MSLTLAVSDIVDSSSSPLLSIHPLWTRVRLAEVATVLNGFPFPSAMFTSGVGTPLIRIRDILTSETEARFLGEFDPAYVVQQGELLIGMDGDFNCALWQGPKGLLNQRVCKVTVCSEFYELKFLAYTLPGYLKAINDVTSSVTVKHLSSRSVEDIPLPLPPLAEQRRIVAAIEQHFTRLDAAVAALKRVQAALKRYRAAVLKAAVEGTLTAEWRRAHPLATPAASPESAQADFAAAGPPGAVSTASSPVEPASGLLARILAERRARWEADLRARGKDPAKARYEEPKRPDTANLPQLPEGWCWTSFGQCFEVHVGATPARSVPGYWDGEIPWVSSGEVQFCRIRETRERISALGLGNSSTQLNPVGSVLLAMIGEGRTRGQVAILEVEACNNQNCAAIWVSKTPIVPEYVYYWLWSQYEVTRRRGSGNNQPALNRARVQELPLPLPPLAEQAQVVAEIEQRLSVVAELEASVEVNLKRAERLRQSILERAFAGQLVPQDPHDEPASALLERIRRERSEETSGHTRRARVKRVQPAQVTESLWLDA